MTIKKKRYYVIEKFSFFDARPFVLFEVPNDKSHDKNRELFMFYAAKKWGREISKQEYDILRLKQ